MFARFKACKSLSISKKLLQLNSNKQKPQREHKLLQNANVKQVLEEYGQSPITPIRTSRVNNKKAQAKPKKDNVYYTSTTCGQTDQENPFVREKLIKRKTRNVGETISKQDDHLSSQSRDSIHCCNSPKDVQNVESPCHKSKIKETRQEARHKPFFRNNLSPQYKRKSNTKEFSTKTSIKQIQSNSSEGPESPLSNGQSFLQKYQHPNPKTLQITLKNMLSQLQTTRKQNFELKEELIKIKSQQFYVLNREKVKEMVGELHKETKLRIKLQKEKEEMVMENKKLKQENKEVRRENVRVKRINAKMKEELVDIRLENLKPRQRVGLYSKDLGLLSSDLESHDQ